MAVSNGLTSVMTNLMADGPAAAAVGPIALNMAGLVHPGTTYLPFMAMSTAISSSFAYCLVIGTPPNAIAIQYMQNAGIAPSFGMWMLLGIPAVIIMLVILWFILMSSSTFSAFILSLLGLRSFGVPMG